MRSVVLVLLGIVLGAGGMAATLSFAPQVSAQYEGGLGPFEIVTNPNGFAFVLDTSSGEVTVWRAIPLNQKGVNGTWGFEKLSPARQRFNPYPFPGVPKPFGR